MQTDFQLITQNWFTGFCLKLVHNVLPRWDWLWASTFRVLTATRAGKAGVMTPGVTKQRKTLPVLGTKITHQWRSTFQPQSKPSKLIRTKDQPLSVLCDRLIVLNYRADTKFFSKWTRKYEWFVAFSLPASLQRLPKTIIDTSDFCWGVNSFRSYRSW